MLNVLNALTTLAAAGATYDPTSHVVPHPIFHIGPLEVTNQMLAAVLAAVLLLIFAFYAAGRITPRPGQGADGYITRGRLAQVFEVICVFIREEVGRPNLGRLTDKYIGYIWTTFWFILFANVLGLVPFGPMLYMATGNAHLEHLSGTATGNLAITGALALVAFFMIHFVGIREQGISYFKHFNPGPVWLAPLLVPLEIVGSLIKPVALAVRLFANMIAGHLVIASLLGIIFMFRSWAIAGVVTVGSVALMCLELFVAFLQAYVFVLLTTLFIAMGAVHEEHEEHHEEGHSGHPDPHNKQFNVRDHTPAVMDEEKFAEPTGP